MSIGTSLVDATLKCYKGLIINVHTIPIIQRYPDDCRIKMGLAGWAFITFQRIMRETVTKQRNAKIELYI